MGIAALHPSYVTALCGKNMEYRATIEYSSALVSSAAWKYWMRKHRQDAILSVIGFLVVAYFFFIEGKSEWYVGFMLAVGVIYLVAVYGGFLAIRRNSLAALRAMGSPEATWHFSDESVLCESGVGKAEIKWASIEQLWRFSDVWLLVFANGAYSALPVSSLTSEIRAFIETKVKTGGGKFT